MFDDIREHWPVAILVAARWTADVDETDEALVWSEPERVEHAPVVGVPLSDPARGKSQRVGSVHQIHRRGAGREHLLPLGDFHVWRGAAYHGNDEGRAGEPSALELELVGGGVGMTGLKGSGDRLS